MTSHGIERDGLLRHHRRVAEGGAEDHRAELDSRRCLGNSGPDREGLVTGPVHEVGRHAENEMIGNPGRI